MTYNPQLFRLNYNPDLFRYVSPFQRISPFNPDAFTRYLDASEMLVPMFWGGSPQAWMDGYRTYADRNDPIIYARENHARALRSQRAKDRAARRKAWDHYIATQHAYPARPTARIMSATWTAEGNACEALFIRGEG